MDPPQPPTASNPDEHAPTPSTSAPPPLALPSPSPSPSTSSERRGSGGSTGPLTESQRIWAFAYACMARARLDLLPLDYTFPDVVYVEFRKLVEDPIQV